MPINYKDYHPKWTLIRRLMPSYATAVGWTYSEYWAKCNKY